MSRDSRSARLESELLQIWYGGKSAGWIKQLMLSVLETVYRLLRFLSRQDKKARLGKTVTKPPVLVVGNLIAGGAGKTPIVMAICLQVTRKGKKAGIISRGYGRSGTGVAVIDPSAPWPDASEVGDEPLFLCAQTRCPVAVGADRNKALEALLTAFPDLDLVVSDDGLQHHRLKRQLEWVVFDERAHGNGRLLPAGPLREPLSRLSTVDAVLCSNLTTSALGRALNRDEQANWHAVHVSLRGFKNLLSGELLTAGQAKVRWADSAVLAFTGIANPDKLFNAVKAAGIDLSVTRSLPDHFAYPKDFCAQFDQQVLITSGKDAVKLDSTNPKVWVAEIAVELPPALTQALEDCIGSTID